jgi:hypothetical protein
VKTRLLAVALAVASAVTVTGCGVPERTQPVIVGNPPREGGTPDVGNGLPPEPAGATSAQNLVERYLQAAAGGNESTTERPKPFDDAVVRVKEFLTGTAAASWKYGDSRDLNVVQATVAPAVRADTGDRVDVVLRPVGTLNQRGELEPAGDRQPFTWSAKVVPPEGPGTTMRIDNPPDGLLLSTTGLNELYEARSIYFWDSNDRYLVPDLRYVALGVPEEQRANNLVDWLRLGPSEWLKSAVNVVPDSIQVKDRVSIGSQPDSRWQVNVAAKAFGMLDQLSRFSTQLQWTLRPGSGAVDLRIENQKVSLPPTDYRKYNRDYLPDNQDPLPFCVSGGQVRQIAGTPVTIPALSGQDNAGVLQAAIASSPTSVTSPQAVAVVRAEGNQQRLYMGSADQRDVGGVGIVRTDLAAPTLSRPVWLVNSGPRVLVAAGGRLYDVVVTGRTTQVNRVGDVDGIAAFALAPDGRRLAYLSRGRIYVAPLLISNDRLAVGSAREVSTAQGDLTDPVGVAWSRENWLVVAGRVNGKTALVEFTVDGGLAQSLQLSNLAEMTITQVVARPVVRPGDERAKLPSRRIMVEANGRAQQVFFASVDAVPNPTPSAQQAVPTAPFFMD